jgi:Mrp family chromosome partitioning ATPase
MDLFTFLRALRRHARIVVAIAGIGVVLGVASSFLPGHAAPVRKAVAPRTYFAATHVLTLDDFSVGIEDSGTSFGLDEIALLATGPDVVARVATRLGTDPADVAERIETVVGANGRTLTIRAVGTDEESALALADGLPPELNQYLRERLQSRVGEERDALVRRMADLRAQQRALDAALAVPGTAPSDRETTEAERDAVVNQYRLAYDRFTRLADESAIPLPLTTLDPGRAFPVTRSEFDAVAARAAQGLNHRAEQADAAAAAEVAPASNGTPSVDGPAARGLLGGLLGLLCALAFVAVRARIDTRIHDRATIEDTLGAPVLAEIPAMTRTETKRRAVLTRDAPLSNTAEAYRSIRSSLLLAGADVLDGEPRGLVVMIASPKPGEGKTLSTANLAVAMAETGRSVLAVNCDFRRPVLRECFGVESAPAQVVASPTPGLHLVTNVAVDPGTNPAVAVAVQRQVVAWARDRYDVVLLDTAPLLVTNDAVDLLPDVDLVVLVARQHTTTTGNLTLARQLLERHRAVLVGAIANCVDTTKSSYYYYYSTDVVRRLEGSPAGSPAPVPESPVFSATADDVDPREPLYAGASTRRTRRSDGSAS